MLVLSNCTSVPSDAESKESADIVLMPSISRGSNRGHADNKPKKDTEPKLNESKVAQGQLTPSKAQQAAAMEVLSKPTSTPSKAKPAPSPELEPTAIPLPSPALPAGDNDNGDDDAPAPRPNAVELRGFRTPKLPGILPMEVKG